MKTTQINITGLQIISMDEAMEINGGFSAYDTAGFTADNARGIGHAIGDFFSGLFGGIKDGINQMLN